MVKFPGNNALVVLAHPLIGWALCAAVIGIGPRFISMKANLIVHAVAAPIFFGLISVCYLNRFGCPESAATALVFVGFVIVEDFFLVALVIEKSMDMFSSPIGTWIPFDLIYSVTWGGGSLMKPEERG